MHALRRKRKKGIGMDDVVELTGLPVASPICFMAALGLLRICTQDHGQNVQLSWSHHARLHGMDRTTLAALLSEHMRDRSKALEFNFEVTDERGGRQPVTHLRTIQPQDYRAAVAACRGDARALGFLAGFATDAVVSDKGFVARTRLDFSSGQQKLMHDFRTLAADLDPKAKRPAFPLATRIERALYGGPYEERHTLGWDPVSLMTHAHQKEAPTDSATPGQPMTIWLAIEALPLHPVIPIEPQRARTTGFAGARAYVWPQWSVPLTLNEVELLRHRPVETLHRLPDLSALWSSNVTSVGKYGFLLPAARISCISLHPETFAKEENAG
jgi:hypothetical protein